MNSKFRLFVISFVLWISIFVVFYFCRSSFYYRRSGAVTQKVILDDDLEALGKKSKKPQLSDAEKLKRKRIGYIYGGALPKFQLSEFENYLKKSNRSPSSLVAVYNLTGDRTLLDELKKQTDSGEAMLCVALKTTGEEGKHYAEIYRKLVPDQMAAHLLYAAALSVGGNKAPLDKKEFVSVVRQGMQSQFLSFGLDSSEQCTRDALKFIGTDALDAEAMLMSVSSGSDVLLLYQRKTLNLGFDIEFCRTSDMAEKINLAKDYLSAAQSMEELSQYINYTHGANHYNSIREFILGHFSPDADFGEGYGRVGNLKDQYLMNERSLEKRKKQVAELLTDPASDMLEKVLEKRIVEGPLKTHEWLTSQIEDGE